MRKLLCVVLLLAVMVAAGCGGVTAEDAKNSSSRNPYGGVTTVGCDSDDGPTCFAYVFDTQDKMLCSILIPGQNYRPEGFRINSIECPGS